MENKKPGLMYWGKSFVKLLFKIDYDFNDNVDYHVPGRCNMYLLTHTQHRLFYSLSINL